MANSNHCYRANLGRNNFSFFRLYRRGVGKSNDVVPYAVTAITVDASGAAIGAVLEQLINNSWQPLALFSRQLTDPERKCCVFDRDLLALYLPIRHIWCFIEDRHFIAFADNI
ncbi:hypothetical protein T06_8549 [Trichinella sp. T6]|nr:hypothetical protein T06_8549 [Trichinella sp. T6]